MPKEESTEAKHARHLVTCIAKRVLADAGCDDQDDTPLVLEAFVNESVEPVVHLVENLLAAQLNFATALDEIEDEDEDEASDEGDPEDEPRPGSRVVNEVLHAVDEKAAGFVRRVRGKDAEPPAGDADDVKDVNEPTPRRRKVRF